MAKALYNSLTNSHDGEAAGTHVLEAGQTLAERKVASTSKNFFVIDVMNDIGIDISSYVRQPLTQEHSMHYDKIVSMVDQNDTPDWLLKSPRYIHWDIKDPRGQNYEITAKIRDEIKHKVVELIAR